MPFFTFLEPILNNHQSKGIKKHLCENNHKVNEFMKLLHRGGRHAYTITFQPKVTANWFDTSNPTGIKYDATNYFFSVNPTNNKGNSKSRASIKDISAINCLFADYDYKGMDAKKVDNQLKQMPRPTFLVLSGHGVHAYWVFENSVALDNDDDREKFNLIQNLWVDKYALADSNCKDIARVMRLPGSFNKKGNEGPIKTDFLQYSPSLLYSYESLINLIPDLDVKVNAKQEGCVTKNAFLNLRKSKYEYDLLQVRLLQRDIPYEVYAMVERTKRACKGESIEFDFNQGKIYNSRSEVEQSIITKLLLRGKKYSEIRTFFDKELPGHYHELGKNEKETYFRQSIDKAIEYVTSDETRKKVEAAYAIVQQSPKYGEGGETCRLFLLALLSMAFFLGKTVIKESDRDIRLFTQIKSQGTLSKVKKKVLKMYSIPCSYRKGRKESTQYDLTSLLSIIQKETINQVPLQPNDIWSKIDNNEFMALSKSGVCGKYFKSVLCTLHNSEKSTKEVSISIGTTYQTAARYLNWMKEEKLIEKNGKLWHLFSIDFDELIDRFKGRERVEEQSKRIQQERDLQKAKRQTFLEYIHEVHPYVLETIEKLQTEAVDEDASISNEKVLTLYNVENKKGLSDLPFAV